MKKTYTFVGSVDGFAVADKEDLKKATTEGYKESIDDYGTKVSRPSLQAFPVSYYGIHLLATYTGTCGLHIEMELHCPVCGEELGSLKCDPETGVPTEVIYEFGGDSHICDPDSLLDGDASTVIERLMLILRGVEAENHELMQAVETHCRMSQDEYELDPPEEGDA